VKVPGFVHHKPAALDRELDVPPWSQDRWCDSFMRYCALIGEELQRQLYASALLLFPIYLEREFCLQYRTIFIADFDFHTTAEAVEAPASYRILCHINQRARRLFLHGFNIGQFKPFLIHGNGVAVA
jgi:hypothetical protein